MKRLVPLLIVQGLAIACSGAVSSSPDARPVTGDVGPDGPRGVVTEIRDSWDAYLAEKAGYYSQCWIPTGSWREAERETWRCYDLALSVVPFGMAPVTVTVEAAADGEYRVRTRFAWLDPPSAAPGWGEHLETTAYAVRERGRWVFSNAVHRNTREWRRETVGPITYVVEPGLGFDRDRALRAVAFANSVADRFEVPRLRGVTYYVTSSTNAAYEAVGVTFAVPFEPGGAFARPVNGQIFSGTLSSGEENRHELVHLLLAPLQTETTSVWASEGVATWLGGTTGLSYEEAVARLRAFLEAHPEAGLDAILGSGEYTNRERYPAAAVLAEMAYEHDGVNAVRRFYAGGPDVEGLRRGTASLLGRPWSEIRAAWRERISALAR